MTSISNSLRSNNSMPRALSVAALTSVSLFALSAAPAFAQSNTITFEDVFANPDDKQLNIDYARQEANAGNLLSAASTLERLLLQDPNWDDARLFYAVVLYRLGDYQGAEREVRILEARPLSDSLRGELEKFKDRIGNKQKKATLSGSVSVGVTYEDNVAVNPEETSGTGLDDYATTLRLRAKYEYDMGGSSDMKFLAVLSTYSKMYDEFEQVDFNFLAARTGFEGANGPYDWRVTLDGKSLDVAGDQYLKEVGVSGRVRREMTPKTSLQFDVDYSDQDYENIIIGTKPTLFEDQRSGTKHTGTVSVKHKLTGNVRSSIGVGVQRKNAELDEYANDTKFLAASLSNNFKNGSYAILNYFYRDVEYDAADPLVVPGETDPREEDRHYMRAAYGMPLSSIWESENANLNKTLDNVIVEASVFRDDRQANYDVYDYDNTGAEVQLTWRFSK